MTIDTTFKEFVDENGVNFCQLDTGSRTYGTLVEAFNKVKFNLGAEEEAREYQKIREWLKLNEQSTIENLPRRHTRRPRRAAFRRLSAADSSFLKSTTESRKKRQGVHMAMVGEKKAHQPAGYPPSERKGLINWYGLTRKWCLPMLG